MPTAPTLARLAVALVSVANATAALTLPKSIAGASPKASFAMGARDARGATLKLQRPPRVPRRERSDREHADALSHGARRGRLEGKTPRVQSTRSLARVNPDTRHR